ncbi:MAG: hypothetical protein ACPL5I_15705, partial [Thermodesulfobacteriota bacterium]
LYLRVDPRLILMSPAGFCQRQAGGISSYFAKTDRRSEYFLTIDHSHLYLTFYLWYSMNHNY